MGRAVTRRRRRRVRLDRLHRYALADPFDDRRYRLRRLGAIGEPVVNPAHIEILVFVPRIVEAKHLEEAAVAWTA